MQRSGWWLVPPVQVAPWVCGPVSSSPRESHPRSRPDSRPCSLVSRALLPGFPPPDSPHVSEPSDLGGRPLRPGFRPCLRLVNFFGDAPPASESAAPSSVFSALGVRFLLLVTRIKMENYILFFCMIKKKLKFGTNNFFLTRKQKGTSRRWYKLMGFFYFLGS